MVHEPKIERRPTWGITVRLIQTDRHAGVIVCVPEDPIVEIEWANENSGGRRISYDTWKFKSLREAEEFVMLFKLRFGTR